MPRFFFNTNDDIDLCDDEGMELPDLDAARRVAIRYAGELLKESRSGLGFNETWQLQASDIDHAVLFTIDLKVSMKKSSSVRALSQGRARPPALRRVGT